MTQLVKRLFGGQAPAKTPPTTSTIKPLSGIQVAEMVREVFAISPLLTAILVEPNIVITLAGARGQTESYVHVPLKLSVQDERAVDWLLHKGISWKLGAWGERIVNLPNDGSKPATAEIVQINVESLHGYAYNSQISHIPGVVPFDLEEGWEGLKTWFDQVRDNIEESYQDKEQFRVPAEGRNPYYVTVFNGFRKGYPDRAILDLIDAQRAVPEGQITTLRSAPILHTHHYQCPLPIFSYQRHHRDDPGIQRTVKLWSEILEQFYTSETFQEIKQEPAFIEARAMRDRNEL